MAHGFHGTRQLESILLEGKLLCPALVSGGSEGYFQYEARKFDRMTSRFAKLTRKALSEHELERETRFRGYTGEITDETLADLGIMMHLFPTLSTEIHQYHDLRRLTHVWLGSYQCAVGYASETRSSYKYPGIVEFEVPDELARHFFVPLIFRKEIPLMYAAAVHVPIAERERYLALLNDKKYVLEVKELEK
jgi:hypothetical protein